MAFLRSWMCGWKMHRPLLSQAWTTTAADADLLFGLELSLWCARCVCDGQVFNSSSLQSSCCFIGCSFCCSWFELPPLARWRRDSPKANEEVMEGGRSSDFLLLCADDGLLLDFFDLLLDDRLLDDDKSKEAAGGEEVPPVWCWCVCVLLVFDRPDDEQPPDLPETETSEQRPPEEPSSIFGGSSNIIINIQRCTSSEVGRKWQGIMFEGCWSRSPFSTSTSTHSMVPNCKLSCERGITCCSKLADFLSVKTTQIATVLPIYCPNSQQAASGKIQSTAQRMQATKLPRTTVCTILRCVLDLSEHKAIINHQ